MPAVWALGMQFKGVAANRRRPVNAPDSLETVTKQQLQSACQRLQMALSRSGMRPPSAVGHHLFAAACTAAGARDVTFCAVCPYVVFMQ